VSVVPLHDPDVRDRLLLFGGAAAIVAANLTDEDRDQLAAK